MDEEAGIPIPARVFGEGPAGEVKPLYAIPPRVKRAMYMAAAFDIIYVITSIAIVLGMAAAYAYAIATGKGVDDLPTPDYISVGAILLAIKSPFDGLGLRVKEARIARKNKSL